MAIGDFGNNNSGNSNNNKLFENTYYSRLRMRSSETKLALTPTFNSGLLKLEISEIKEGFKYEKVISISLSPTKARLLAAEIEKFKAYYIEGNIIPGKAYGVNAGMNDKVTYIGFHATTERHILVTIGKFDGNGNIVEATTIPLNVDYHFALEWSDINNMDINKVYNDTLELDQLHDLLEDFGRHMNGAIAYSVADLTRYDNARILGKMDPIYDKLGIERKSSNGNGNYESRSNSFLENSGRVNSSKTTIEDVEDLFG